MTIEQKETLQSARNKIIGAISVLEYINSDLDDPEGGLAEDLQQNAIKVVIDQLDVALNNIVIN